MADLDESVPPERKPVVVFPFAVQYPVAHVSRLFAIDPDRARLELRGDRLGAVFGPWKISTELANVDSIEVTGPYSPLKVIGPPHLSLSDGGLTFATNAHAGLCLHFRNAVAGLLPIPLPRVGSLTVTVDDPEKVRDVLERSLRTMSDAPDEEVAVERLVQGEQDTIQAMTSAQLRDQATALGMEHVNSLSHSELVEKLENGDAHEAHETS